MKEIKEIQEFSGGKKSKKTKESKKSLGGVSLSKSITSGDLPVYGGNFRPDLPAYLILGPEPPPLKRWQP